MLRDARNLQISRIAQHGVAGDSKSGNNNMRHRFDGQDADAGSQWFCQSMWLAKPTSSSIGLPKTKRSNTRKINEAIVKVATILTFFQCLSRSRNFFPVRDGAIPMHFHEHSMLVDSHSGHSDVSSYGYHTATLHFSHLFSIQLKQEMLTKW
jgi:hypothetical protein